MKSYPVIADKTEVKAVSKRARRKWNIIDFRDAYEPIYELS